MSQAPGAGAPLRGRRVVVTRAASAADPFVAALRARGAEPISVPVLVIEPPDDPTALDAAARRLDAGGYGVTLFTSQNAVTALFGALQRAGLGPTALSGTRVCAVGPATARALTSRGVAVDAIAEEHVGEALVPVVLALCGRGGERGGELLPRPRVLLPRAETARDALPAGLVAAGFEVDVVTAYVTRAVLPGELGALLDGLERGDLGVLTFTSSSAVTALVGALVAAVGADRAHAALGRTTLASIGPHTTATAESLGLPVRVTAKVHTTEGLIEALERHFSPPLPGSDG